MSNDLVFLSRGREYYRINAKGTLGRESPKTKLNIEEKKVSATLNHYDDLTKPRVKHSEVLQNGK